MWPVVYICPSGLTKFPEFVDFDFVKGAGYLYNHEWPVYALDAVLIFVSPFISPAIFSSSSLVDCHGYL